MSSDTSRDADGPRLNRVQRAASRVESTPRASPAESVDIPATNTRMPATPRASVRASPGGRGLIRTALARSAAKKATGHSAFQAVFASFVAADTTEALLQEQDESNTSDLSKKTKALAEYKKLTAALTPRGVLTQLVQNKQSQEEGLASRNQNVTPSRIFRSDQRRVSKLLAHSDAEHSDSKGSNSRRTRSSSSASAAQRVLLSQSGHSSEPSIAEMSSLEVQRARRPLKRRNRDRQARLTRKSSTSGYTRSSQATSAINNTDECSVEDGSLEASNTNRPVRTKRSRKLPVFTAKDVADDSDERSPDDVSEQASSEEGVRRVRTRRALSAGSFKTRNESRSREEEETLEKENESGSTRISDNKTYVKTIRQTMTRRNSLDRAKAFQNIKVTLETTKNSTAAASFADQDEEGNLTFHPNVESTRVNAFQENSPSLVSSSTPNGVSFGQRASRFTSTPAAYAEASASMQLRNRLKERNQTDSIHLGNDGSASTPRPVGLSHTVTADVDNVRNESMRLRNRTWDRSEAEAMNVDNTFAVGHQPFDVASNASNMSSMEEGSTTTVKVNKMAAQLRHFLKDKTSTEDVDSFINKLLAPDLPQAAENVNDDQLFRKPRTPPSKPANRRKVVRQQKPKANNNPNQLFSPRVVKRDFERFSTTNAKLTAQAMPALMEISERFCGKMLKHLRKGLEEQGRTVLGLVDVKEFMLDVGLIKEEPTNMGLYMKILDVVPDFEDRRKILPGRNNMTCPEDIWDRIPKEKRRRKSKTRTTS